jgi:putative ABC transport system ATP-binding protein
MILIENVTKTYKTRFGQVPALRGISCQLPQSAFTFIVGPSGSGKSTLLYLIGALDQPTSGEVVVMGTRLSTLDRKRRDRFRRDQVGFVFQDFNLLANLTALENVLCPYMPSGINGSLKKSAQDLLDRVGLKDRFEHRPSQLSGGEQQRVAIARALLKRPAVVLADEPTGELDSVTGAEIYKNLRDLCAEHGSTVVIVTHDRSFVEPRDLVISIRDGRAVEETAA